MPRRRAAARDEAPWLSTFVEADWPGRCSLERFHAWRNAQQAEPGELGAMSAARRAARRALQHSADCPIHVQPVVWPTGWNRGSERTVFALTDRDGTSSTEEVDNDSQRDVELRRSFEEWLQRLV